MFNNGYDKEKEDERNNYVEKKERQWTEIEIERKNKRELNRKRLYMYLLE